MIIDVHTHLGDILYPGGGALIEKKGVKKKFVIDPITISEKMHHLDIGGVNFESWLGRLIVRADHARNQTATWENMRTAMNSNGIKYSAVMPVPPYVTFADLRDFARRDHGIIPFTAVDFSSESDVGADLDRDVQEGARGMKLHPIIQKEPLTSKKTFAAVETFSRHVLPILFHAGISHYYLGSEKNRQSPELGAIHYARDLIKAFPKTRFIAGHAGLFQIKDCIEMLGPFKNVWVDISFQPPKYVRKLVEVFGPERVLYGSDWPWGSMKTPITIAKKACKGDQFLMKRILFENAAELMNLDPSGKGY